MAMSETADLLRAAIERNAPAAFTVTSGGLSRLTRSRLYAGDASGLWLGMPAGQADAVDSMVRAGEAARVNFKSQQTNIEFHARVLERRRAYPLNATTLVEAVKLEWPSELKIVQRRQAYRVGFSHGDAVRLRFWRIGPNDELAAPPPAGTEMTIDVRDFSAAGAGGIWKRRRGEPSVLGCDQRLRVDVVVGATVTTLDAYVRFLAGLPEPDYRRIGVQFMLRPTNLADRHKAATLTQITGELERAELKRLRVAR